MSNEFFFTKEHEWIAVEDNYAKIGITDFAQSELGDIIFVELPEINDVFESNEVFGTIEAVKTVADLYMPVSANIIEVNNNIEDTPELINSDAQSLGWIVKVELKDKTELNNLLSLKQYKEFINKWVDILQ